MHGLTDGLDPSSAYLTPDEVRAVETRGAQPAGDVGLVVTRQFYLRVLGVRDGSPAAKAGLQTGDYLRMIDGRPTRDMSAFTGTRLLRGATGTQGRPLTVIRGNAADPHVIELTRETTPAESATVKPLPGGVAHVRVAGFGPGTAAALKKIFDGLAGQKLDERGDRPARHRRRRAGRRHRGGAAVRQERRARGARRTRRRRASRPTRIPATAPSRRRSCCWSRTERPTPPKSSRPRWSGTPAPSWSASRPPASRPSRNSSACPQNYGLWLTTERYLTVDGAGPIHERGLRPDRRRRHPDRRLRRSAADHRRAAQQGGRAAARQKEGKSLACGKLRSVAIVARVPSGEARPLIYCRSCAARHDCRHVAQLVRAPA